MAWAVCHCNINETIVLQTANLMKSLGLQDVGYEHVNIDDCWSEKNRSTSGDLVANRGRFPSGMKSLTDNIHALGFTATRAGSLVKCTLARSRTKTEPSTAAYGIFRVDRDAKQFQDWGFELLKGSTAVRELGITTLDQTRNVSVEYQRMANAIANLAETTQKPPILFSLCEWGRSYDRNNRGCGRAAWDSRGDLYIASGNGDLTFEEAKSHFTAWALMKSPLLISTDLSVATNQTLQILKNTEIIAINQDSVVGTSISPFRWGINLNTLNEPADMFFNLTESPWIRAGRQYSVRDLWTHTDNGTAVRNFTAHQVPPHGVVALLLKDAGDEPAGLWPPCARFEWCTDQNGTRFSSCYDQTSTQEEIFQNDVQPMIDVVYSGVTVTIFAYGVTSSGKTHTMQGTKSEPGVIPRTIRAMFDKKETITGYSVSLLVSYMEIYKDEVYDLLVTRENSGHKTSFEARLYDPAENKTLIGKINLVDLAGSENNKLTGNDPSRMAESAAINKSLSVLGQVVHALNSGASRIPYRNSKLTRILQDALGGSSIGLLICNLAPGTKFRQDTLNTLNFAVRTKNVENKPVINERDNRPVPKPHFAAVTIHPPPAKPAPAIIQAISTAGSSSGAGPRRSRQSLVPVSKFPRASVSGGYQPFVLPGARKGLLNFAEKIMEEDSSDRSGSFGFGLTEKEIDERISKAVEAEVARRLEERERQREKEEQERHARERELESQQPTSSATQTKPQSPKKEQTLPPGVLTPLLKRHKDLDNELKTRLQELERKLQVVRVDIDRYSERENKEAQLADVLSPVAKKKTGRAYVALARAHSEKGDLQVALDLYRKAESYVPDNAKLKERIIEIEWAVKNNREFVPTPKPPRKAKKQKTKAAPVEDVDMDVDEGKPKPPNGRLHEATFGLELTNTSTNSPSKTKRQLDVNGDDDEAGTSPKKQRRNGAGAAVVAEKSDDDDEDWVCLAPYEPTVVA
ncbi:hypothetical protein C0995_003631 [Termitomyces sp. Mi166|nr:hypothetical protein C0995_003631 [Termitomyces sp. Mi166\